MRRDMDKVRGVLLALEAMPSPFVMRNNGDALGGTANWPETVEYIMMLKSAGFLEHLPPFSYRITWSGHEFLETVRDPDIWTTTRDAAKKVGSTSLVLLTELAAGALKAKAQSLGFPML